MKKYLPALFTLMITSFTLANGQDSITYSKHIGINALSLNYYCENYIPPGYKIIVPTGITYEKDYRRITAIYSIKYSRVKTKYKELWIDGYSGYNYYTIWSISSGIQKNFHYGKFCIFYGLDLFSNLSIYKVDYDGGIFGGGVHEKYSHLWLGLSPDAGFKVNIVPRVTLSVQTSYNLAFRIVNTDNDQYQGIGSFQHYINPIEALTIFYNF